LHTQASPELTRLLGKIRTGQTVLGTLSGVLLTELIGLSQLSQSLLLSLKLRGLIQLLRLQALTRTKLLLVDHCLKISLTRLLLSSLISQRSLKT
jgi:hypothetical protein